MKPLRRIAAGGWGWGGHGFTLIEVLVVMTVMATLMGMLLPALAKSRDAAKNAGCLARLHDLSLCTVLYAHDYKCLPVWGTTGSLRMLQLPPALWWCPADRLRSAEQLGSSYTYLGLLYMGPAPDIDVPSSLNPRLALKLYEDNPQSRKRGNCGERHPHRNVAFWDGVARKWWD